MIQTHETETVTQVGPGGSNSWVVCTCGWEGRSRYRRDDAIADAVSHLKDCLLQSFESDQ